MCRSLCDKYRFGKYLFDNSRAGMLTGVRGRKLVKKHMKHPESGFTLIELSIVFVELGSGGSCGPLVAPGLQAVKKFHGLLGMRCGTEDGALVVLQHG